MSGAAHTADESDEATRILQAENAIAPSGDIQAMQVARPAEADEEHTTILLHTALDETEDERTTILHAPEGVLYGTVAEEDDEHAGGLAPFLPPLNNGEASRSGLPAVPEHETSGEEDEPTTILTTATPEAGHEAASQDWGIAGPGWTQQARLQTQEAGAGENVSRSFDATSAGDPTAEEEERTTILTSAAAQEDERTTILQNDHPPTDIQSLGAGAGGSSSVFWSHPGPSPAQIPQPAHAPEAGRPEAEHWTATLPQEAGTQEPTSIVPAAEPPPGPADSTEILPAAALAGLPDTTNEADGQVSGRAWFDRRLRDFNHALLHTQTGQRRPAAERQSLAAAARDMIQRVGLRDPEHKATDWADTVLQADQLLVNTYFVRALIARGGVGEIYRARHRDLKTEHAIKILLPRYALDPTVLTLMLEEARLLQRVRHEAVVGCQGLLRDTDGRPMLVMDYLRGRTLSARLRDGPLPQADLILLAARLASGLSALHAQGLVHQDISPDNIILVDDNCAAATIIDFGLARSLDAPENTHRNIDFAGKFSWCSPEQLSSRATNVDARSDLYSLGLVLAAAARGTRLDMGNDLASARAARHGVPPLGGIQEPVATLLRHLLAPSTATRLRSAEEVPDWLRAKRPGLVQRLFGR